jgi:hypothetical protein
VADNTRPPVAVRIIRPYETEEAFLESELETRIGQNLAIQQGQTATPVTGGGGGAPTPSFIVPVDCSRPNLASGQQPIQNIALHLQLGDRFTADLQTAWLDAYRLTSAIMQRGELSKTCEFARYRTGEYAAYQGAVAKEA